MELRYLKYFVTVAERQNFTRAAEELHVAQPAISQQIKSLEEELGVSLLHRTKRSVKLTAAGHAFLSEAREILAHAELSKQIARRAARGETGSPPRRLGSRSVCNCWASPSARRHPPHRPCVRTEYPVAPDQGGGLAPMPFGNSGSICPRGTS